MTPSDFIAAIGPAAQASALQTKIPASFCVAEAAQESGWGKHCPGFNIFGVKADESWQGPVVVDPTKESVDGTVVIVKGTFRAYASWQDSLLDHAQFLLSNSRYRPAFAHADGIGFAYAVAAAGYATDPNYAKEIVELIQEHQLQALDVVKPIAA